MKRKLVPGMFMRHFKGKLYQIITVASHSETMESYVVYQALYGDYKTYVRPYDMFMSEVDHDKYPNAKQKFRFEEVTLSASQPTIVDQEGKESMEVQDEKKKVFINTTKESESLHDSLISFLDARESKDKIEILDQHKEEWTSQMLNSMAMSLDFVLRSEVAEEQVSEIKNFLQTRMRFEERRR